MNIQTKQKIGSLIPRKRVAMDLGVCTRTVATREATDPNFPRAIIINYRRYYVASDIEEYKQTIVARAMMSTAE